jgi:hypothetical protein
MSFFVLGTQSSDWYRTPTELVQHSADRWDSHRRNAASSQEREGENSNLWLGCIIDWQDVVAVLNSFGLYGMERVKSSVFS